MDHHTVLAAVERHLGPAYLGAIKDHIETQAASLKHVSMRVAAHDDTLSDIGKILGDESMPGAKIVQRVRELVSVNKSLHATIKRYEDQWIDEHV